MNEKQATFGAGCFWGVEAAFRRLEGVDSTRVGYAGGTKESPTYQEVCYTRTGHAEVVEVTYDEDVIPYEALLAVFWSEHDPTQLNRQGPDDGEQYRSAIFVHDEAQRAAAEASRDRVQAQLSKPVVTQIEDAQTFWGAEDYHQQYLEKRGLTSCTARLATAVS
jgi:peptide-methionine (S)-S-oxide reductase